MILKSTDGTIITVTEYRTITREELQADVNEAEVRLTETKRILSEYDALSGPTNETIAVVEPENIVAVQAPIATPEAPEVVQAPTPEANLTTIPVAEPIALIQ